jgi:hypothetical protein
VSTLNSRIPTENDVRSEQRQHTTAKERDYWLSKAEEFRDQLEAIFEAAKKDGHVELWHRGEKIKLYLQPSATTNASTTEDGNG